MPVAWRERIAEREVSPDASVQGGADEECDGAGDEAQEAMKVLLAQLDGALPSIALMPWKPLSKRRGRR